MLRTIIRADGIVAETVQKLLGHERPFVNCTAIGVLDGDRLIAGVIYHEWSPEHGTIQMSVAATTSQWINKSILRAIFAYPFDQVGCQMVIMRVAESNARMRRIGKTLGCKEYLIPRLRGRNEAEAVLTLTDDDWKASKFMRTSHG